MDMWTATGLPQWRAGVKTQLRAMLMASPMLPEDDNWFSLSTTLALSTEPVVVTSNSTCTALV